MKYVALISSLDVLIADLSAANVKDLGMRMSGLIL